MKEIIIKVDEETEKIIRKKFYFEPSVFILYTLQNELRNRRIKAKIEKDENEITITKTKEDENG